ncbi:MAG: enoyl-[acyl-carrier-protein] reductase FabK [Chloroflexi bacterium]|nr:enoyl-[acyl-carrier-protein] reductase FabK [Chloroflexota bacterium]
MKKTELCKFLGIEHPIILGAMGGISTGKLAAAVSNAGALGSVATAFISVEESRREIQECKRLTTKPFAVNCPLFRPDMDAMLDAIFAESVGIVSTSAGSPERWAKKIKGSGAKWLHVVSNVRGAVKAVAAGVDVVIAEGTESGGIASRDEITTMVLIPQVVDTVNVPVVAAGGIADARGFLAALALGAQGIQMGTTFLATKECDRVSDTYKQMLLNASDTATGLATRKAYPVRIIKNKLFDTLQQLDEENKPREEIQMILAPKMMNLSQENDPENGFYVAGQVAGLINEIKTVKELIEGIVTESEKLYRSLAD